MSRNFSDSAPFGGPADGGRLQLAAALPDLLTAALILWVWIDPTSWREQLVASFMLVMLLEFILIHSAPFLGSLVFAHGQPRLKRITAVGGMGLMYSIFVAGWAYAFEALWAILAFAWLLGAKLVAILIDRQIDDMAKERQQGLWALSVGWYLIAVIGTIIVPLPELGVTKHGSAYGIPGSGEWVSHPHTVIAAGFAYFSLLAISKLRGWDLSVGRSVATQKRTG